MPRAGNTKDTKDTKKKTTTFSFVFFVSFVSFVSMSAATFEKQSRTKPRLFDPLDLGLLETPDRDQWQKPEMIMDELQIAEGSTVADLGAGSGWFTLRLARRVGPNGV